MDQAISCDAIIASTLIYANFANKGERTLMKKERGLRISARFCSQRG